MGAELDAELELLTETAFFFFFSFFGFKFFMTETLGVSLVCNALE